MRGAGMHCGLSIENLQSNGWLNTRLRFDLYAITKLKFCVSGNKSQDFLQPGGIHRMDRLFFHHTKGFNFHMMKVEIRFEMNSAWFFPVVMAG